MVERIVVMAGAYRDSVALMQAAQAVSGLEDVDTASAVMATPLNLEILQRSGFSADEIDAATPADLVLAVRARSDAAAESALDAIDRALTAGSEDAGTRVAPPRSLAAAARRAPDADLAVISVPGDSAAYECAAALEAGLNVFCFSSGFDVGIEAALKRRALELGLLLMGPDCGTAILAGTGIGFANEIERGPVGIVAASGTGAQQISCLLDAAGVGVSELIGVGGRDLKQPVGGSMSARAISILGEDPATECIVVVGKSPDPRIAAALASHSADTGKPTVLAMPGAAPMRTPAGVVTVDSLEAAAARAAELCGSELNPESPSAPAGHPGAVRGFFCGGTLRNEAVSVFAQHLPADRRPLSIGDFGEDIGDGDAFIDFGSESLTRGHPHPMIDPTLRNRELERQAGSDGVGVVLADVVLGRCAHPDPAPSLAAAMESARAARGTDAPAFVVSLCGTERDPQGLKRQAELLTAAGATVVRSNAEGARIALEASGAARRAPSEAGRR